MLVENYHTTNAALLGQIYEISLITLVRGNKANVEIIKLSDKQINFKANCTLHTHVLIFKCV